MNETRGWSGQVVDVYGGDTVHYEADAGYTGHVYSGYLKGGFTFAPLIAWNGDSKKTACWNMDYRRPFSKHIP